MSPFPLVSGLTGGGMRPLTPMVYGLVGYVLWRLWRFTIRPFVTPNSPRELSYTIPFIGHAISMLRDPHALLSSTIKYCNSSWEPVALTIFGHTVIFVFSEQDATEVLRERPDIIHTEHIKDLLHGLGCSGPGISEIDNDHQSTISVSGGKVIVTNRPSLYKVAEELMKKQLLDRNLGNELLARTLKVLETQARWGGIGTPTLLDASEDGQNLTVSLWKWAQVASIRAITTAWFGNAIWELSPSIIDDHIQVDHGLWQLLFRIPKPFAREVYAARARVQHCLVEFLRLPESKKGDQSWAIKAAVAEMRIRGMSEEDMASYLLMVFWATNANTFKIVFWLIAHIASNPATLEAVTTEVASILSADAPEPESLSLSSLSIGLERNPLLEALYNEVHRIALSTSSARTMRQDVTINGRIFKAGTHTVVPYRQLAMSHPLLSQDWDLFRPERFLSNPELGQSKSFLPFGGGKHKCVGRFLSRRLVLTFTALLVHRFTIRPLDQLPEMGFRPVSSGPGSPISDMRLVISRRQGQEDEVSPT
ncbi:cytochrome P450 [Aspergillus undulatus]|uniref:cytochrome P450 n=1 Tax=Aspergillus undulatus TaxID=1810928 RepID=UPI003CCD31D0